MPHADHPVDGWDGIKPQRRSLSLDRSHQAGVAAGRRGVDASHALGREARHIVRSAGLRTGAAEAFATEGLAFDYRADLVAVDVKIADAGMLLNIIADGVDPALEAQGQSVARGVDVLDDLVEPVAGKTDYMQDRTKILMIQLA